MTARLRESMSSDTVQKLAQTLQEALTLLKEAAYAAPEAGAEAVEHGTLLQQCLAMCEQGQLRQQPEAIRTVHHFACAGGTLICKCLAAMPNVQLLSELDPLSTLAVRGDRPRFAPTDMVTQMHQSTRGTSQETLVELFRSEVKVIHAEASRLGQRLVLRDHAHSHFCNGPEIADRPALRGLLPPSLPVRSIVTVRHPLDSYASLVEKKWVLFSPATLDEYCRRYLVFLQAYADVPRLRYEDVVASPAESLQRACELLDLPYSADFVDLFSVFKLTGDSGRSGAVIAARPRRALAETLLDEARASGNYQRLVSELGYDASPIEARA